jgi:hypothetical protein
MGRNVLPEYNTERDFMQISEYGRNVQKMVQYAVNEPNREKRTVLVHALITLMGNLNPQLRDMEDYKHKLWDHLFIISDFKLDADSPYPTPTRDTVNVKPEIMAYPQHRIKFRFYGKNIEKMIEQASEMADGPTKAGFINLIGSFMKQSCRSWNEEMLQDEEILAHLEMLSDGRIKLTSGEDVQFNALQFRNRQAGGNPNQNRFKNNRNNNNNNNRNNNRNRNFRNKNRGN